MSQRRGRVNQNTCYVLGVIGAAAGFLAGVSAANGSLHAVSAVAGVTAGLIAAVQTFLTRREKSRFQFDKAADASEVALIGRVLSEGEHPPSQDQLIELAQRLSAIRRRPFDYRGAAASTAHPADESGSSGHPDI
jgi:hypothetical protein